MTHCGHIIKKKSGFKAGTAEISWQAATQIALSTEDTERMLKLQDMLEDLDDVQNVYSNSGVD